MFYREVDKWVISSEASNAESKAMKNVQRSSKPHRKMEGSRVGHSRETASKREIPYQVKLKVVI